MYPTLADFGNDGRNVLRSLVANSPWKSLDQALASLTVFAHPDIANAFNGGAVFKTIRGNPRGLIAGEAMLDDNSSPAAVFQWSTGFSRANHLQCNHLFAASNDPSAYTDIRNICYSPSFLAKLTDSQQSELPSGHVLHVLRYRAQELYGYAGPRGTTLPKPAGYDLLVWAEPVGQGATREALEAAFRERLRKRPKDRLAKAVNQLGWIFSDLNPDGRVHYSGA